MLPGVGGDADRVEDPIALSKYDESDGVSVRDGVETAYDGVPTRAASVVPADVDVDADAAAGSCRSVARSDGRAVGCLVPLDDRLSVDVASGVKASPLGDMVLEVAPEIKDGAVDTDGLGAKPADVALE